MEIEKEKRKIEFWDGSQDIWNALNKHKPKKPFTKYVNVSVIITYLPSESNKRFCMNIIKAADEIATYMQELGYIKHQLRVEDVQVRKPIGDTPGIAFFMQEVE